MHKWEHSRQRCVALRTLAMVLVGLVPVGMTAAGDDTDTLISLLQSVPTSESHAYQLRDDGKRVMDCLKVFQPVGDRDAGVYGVYHAFKDGIFSVHLARSRDLLNWSHVESLDAHASQATIWNCDNGAYLLAYEKDAPNSCWMRFRYYEDLASLSEGRFSREFDIQRTLAPTGEGTPSFESVKLTQSGLDRSKIRIRFHYFKNARVDQLARGTLTNFKSWKAIPSRKLNASLIRRGVHGNLGDRDKFIWNGKSYYLQECQHVLRDWSSWRVFLCDGRGMPIRKLAIRTHEKATAFANPSATWITDSMGQRKLVVTLFLPGEGNSPAEAGELIYVIDPSKKPRAREPQLRQPNF